MIKEKGDHSLKLEILRNGETLTVDVTPKQVPSKNVFGEDIQKYVVGITASNTFTVKQMGLFESLSEGFVQTWEIAKLTVLSVGKLITGSLSAKTVGGPIMIAQLAGDHARAGVTNFIFFIALLSVNLGILNLLPIPVLDGGHLLFFFIEAVGRKPVNLRMREVAQQIGMVVLILLMVFVFYNDITRIFD
jgi:regulator of sigma E protease